MRGRKKRGAKVSLPVVELGSLEGVAQRELEGARAAGAKELTRGADGLVERRRGNVVVEAGIVGVVGSTNVSDVEQVENLGDELQLLALGKVESFGDAQVE